MGLTDLLHEVSRRPRSHLFLLQAYMKSDLGIMEQNIVAPHTHFEMYPHPPKKNFKLLLLQLITTGCVQLSSALPKCLPEKQTFFSSQKASISFFRFTVILSHILCSQFFAQELSSFVRDSANFQPRRGFI